MASPRRNPEERQKNRIKDLDEKWKMLFNEKQRPPLYSVDKYIEYLRKFTTAPSLDDSTVSQGSTRSASSIANSEQQIAYLLKKLKLDLKMSYERFLEEFINDPNNGLKLLLTLLKNIQKTNRDDPKGTAKEKMQSKKRLMSEELECIMCIKFCLRYKDSASILLKVPYALENVAEALLSSNIRSRCTALEIMSKVLMEDEGFHRNLECFTYFRLKNCEPVRFKFLINMLMTAGSSSVQVSFQLCCMKFINSLLTSSPDGNMRIFLQSEVEMAGLDVKVLLKSVDSKAAPEREELKTEIIDYRNSLLDVDQLLESHEALYNLNIELQQKVFELQQQLELAKGFGPGIVPTPIEVAASPEVTHEYDETLHGLEELDELLESIESDSDISITVPVTKSSSIKRRGSNRNWKKAGRQLPITKRKENSAIIPDTSGDELKKRDCNDNLQNCPDRLHPNNENFQTSEKIKFIEQIRSDIFLAVKTKIGLTAEEIVECLQNCDRENISIENVNVLLTLLPTECEMRNIVSLDCALDHLGEAEQFLVQLMSVEHLEEKLKIMLFVDQFNAMVGDMSKEVVHVKESCASLSSCHKFSKVLEVIRNYMVDNYYSTPLDFKLSVLVTLETTFLHTCSQNLLEYLVQLIYKTYPDLFIWYQDLDLQVNTKVSFKRFSQFITETKDGLHAMEVEKAHSTTDKFDQLYVDVCERFNEFYENFLEMEGIFMDTCNMFRENPKNVEPVQLFGYVSKFKDSYKNIAENLPKTVTITDVMSEPEPDYLTDRGNTETNEIRKTTDEQSKLSDKLTASDTDSFGLNITMANDDRERIQNWIVMTTQFPEINTDVFSEHFTKPLCRLKHHDSDSGDSAFEGSGGRCLKRYVEMKENAYGPRASTPLTVYPAVNEPPPDYSRSNSPEFQDKPFDDLSSEVSRILREFEGDLNGYETNLTSPVKRRFYTIGSIVHL